MIPSSRVVVAAAVAVGMFAAASARAGSGTWSTTAASGDLSVVSNWSTGGPISASASALLTDTLTFGSSTSTSLFQSANNFALNLTFNAGASSYAWDSQNFNLSLGRNSTTNPNTQGTLTNNAGVEIFNMGTGTLGINGFITGSGTTIINGSVSPGFNVNSNSRNLTFTNSGSVYLNVDTATLTGGAVVGGNGSAATWAASTNSSNRARMSISGTGTVYAGNIGTAYLGPIFLNGGTSKLQLTGGAFAGSGTNGSSYMAISGEGSTLELNDITGNGITVTRSNFFLDARTGTTPHILNIAGNNTLALPAGGYDWDSNNLTAGNWNIRSDAGKLTIAGGNFYATSANVTTTLQLSGAGDGQIDSMFLTYDRSTMDVVKSGAGTWTLTNVPNAGAQDVFGTTILATATAGQPSVFHGAITVAQGTLAVATANGGIAGATAVDVRSGAIFDVSGLTGGNLTLGNTPGNANAMLKGAGTVTGSLTTAGAGNTIAPGDASVNGGVGTLTISNALTLNDGSTLQYQLTGTPTSSSGVNDLIAVGGNLSLAGTTTVAVTTTSGSLGNGTYTLLTYGGALSGDATNLALSGVSAGGRQTFNFDTGTANQVNLVVAGSAANLTWVGGNNSNAWDVATTVNWTGATGPTPDNRFFNGDNVNFTTSGTATPNVVGTVAPGQIDFTNGAGKNYTISGDPINATGPLSTTGAGDVTFTNSSLTVPSATLSGAGTTTFSGPSTTVNGGLSVSGTGNVNVTTGNFGVSGALTMGSSGNFQFSNGGGTVSLGSAAISNGTTTFGTSTTISGPLSVTGAGNVNVTAGDFGVSGAFTMGGTGTVTFSNSGSGLSLGSAAINGGVVAINRTDDLTVAANLTSTGSTGKFQKLGTNAVTLSGNNSGFTGTIEVASGILTAGSTTALGGATTTTTVLSGAALDIFGRKLAPAVVTIAGNGTTNAGGVALGALADTSAGGTAAARRGSVGGIILSADASISSTVNTYPVMSGTGVFLQGNGHNLTVFGGGEWDFYDAGETHLANITLKDSATYFGTTTTLGDQPGVVTLQNNGGLGLDTVSSTVTKPVVVSNVGSAIGGLIAYNSDTTVNGPITLGGDGTTNATLSANVFSSTSNQTRVLTLGGQITGAGNLEAHMNANATVSRAGRIDLTADNNNYTGTTKIGGGDVTFGGGAGNDRIVLSVGNGGPTGSLGSGAVTVTGPAVLQFNRTGSLTVGNAISGTGSVRQVADGGTVTLTADNAYTGTTTVSAGTLVVTGNMSSATGAVAVDGGDAAGGTLRGSGTLGGAVTVGGGVVGGTVRAGTGPTATAMTLANGLAVASGGRIYVDVYGGSPSTGTSGSSSGVNTNNVLNITGGATTIDPLAHVTIDANGMTFSPNSTYSYQIATGAGDQSGLSITDQSQFGVTNYAGVLSNFSLSGDSLGGVYVSFITPTPEPAAILGLSALVVVAGRRWNRGKPSTA